MSMLQQTTPRNHWPPAPPTPQSTVGLELRKVLARMIRACPKSRQQIAHEMGNLLSVDISHHQINAWTAPSAAGWRFPLEYAHAIEQVCESYALTEFLAELRGCRVLVGEDLALAELAELEMEEHRLLTRKASLQAQIQGRLQ